MTVGLFLRLPNTLKIQTELQFFGSTIKIIIWSLAWEFFNPFRGSRERFWNCTLRKQKSKFPSLLRMGQCSSRVCRKTLYTCFHSLPFFGSESTVISSSSSSALLGLGTELSFFFSSLFNCFLGCLQGGVGRDFETAQQLNRTQNSLGIISFDNKVLTGSMGQCNWKGCCKNQFCTHVLTHYLFFLLRIICDLLNFILRCTGIKNWPFFFLTLQRFLVKTISL